MYLANTGQKEAGIAVLIAVKIKIKAKSITKIKEDISQKVLFPSKIINVSFSAPKHVKSYRVEIDT